MHQQRQPPIKGVDSQSLYCDKFVAMFGKIYYGQHGTPAHKMWQKARKSW